MLIIIGTLFVLGANIYILSFGKNVATDVNAVEPKSVALVFGGGMKPDGQTMSEMQADRVARAVELYQSGKAHKLLMTGDDGQNKVDEVHAMHDAAVAAGIPDLAVDIDPHGYNTYKSCARAKEVYHLSTVIVVSQSFHLPRIMYFCQKQGLQVTGLSADLQDYGLKAKLWPQGAREWLARVKAVISVRSAAVGNIVLN